MFPPRTHTGCLLVILSETETEINSVDSASSEPINDHVTWPSAPSAFTVTKPLKFKFISRLKGHWAETTAPTLSWLVFYLLQRYQSMNTVNVRSMAEKDREAAHPKHPAAQIDFTKVFMSLGEKSSSTKLTKTWQILWYCTESLV